MTYQQINALPMYFILAKGRSGTTLLQTMFDAHPNTIAPFESRFLVHLQNRYRNTKIWTIQKKEAFINDVINEQKIALFWNLDQEKLKAYLDMCPEDASYATVCKMVYLSFKSIFNKKQPSCIIDKNPVYSWLIPLILDIVPDAKFIHLIRDPRACVNSTLKLQQVKATSVARRWSTNNMYIEKFKEKSKDSFITIHYEQMIQYPKECLTKVCAFLNIPFIPIMTKYHEQVADSIEDFLTQTSSDRISKIRRLGFEKVHKNLVRPLDPSRINSWKESMSKKQIDETSNATRYLLELYDYESPSEKKKANPWYLSKIWDIHKTQLYYRLPIWLRELKSKPTLVFLGNE